MSLSDSSKERLQALRRLRCDFWQLPDKQQVWNDLIRLTSDHNADVSYGAVSFLYTAFSQVPAQQQGCDDLIKLYTHKDDSYVKFRIGSALDSIVPPFPEIRQIWNDLCRESYDRDKGVESNDAEQSIDQNKIHNQLYSNNPRERIKALKQIRYNFSLLSDKQQAWNDLIQLINDQIYDIKYGAVSTLYFVFFQLPDKQQAKARDDLEKLSLYNDSYVKSKVESILSSTPHVSDLPMPSKHKTDDIGKMVDQNEIHKLLFSNSLRKRLNTLTLVRYNFLLFPDKQQVWNDLAQLVNDQNEDVRYGAASILDLAFSHVSDKQQAWNDLIKFSISEYDSVRSRASSVLGSVFSQVPDKQQAWNELHKLANDQRSSVRSCAASSLGPMFPEAPDKQQAWNDLHRLSLDQDVEVRQRTARSLGYIFSYVPDKQQAWDDLHRLTEDQDINVKRKAVNSLGFAFSQIPNKQQAWNDLHRLSLDQDVEVRQITARSLGSAFSYVSDKQQAWDDLRKMASDENSGVKAFANHSMGKASIFKASQAESENNYRKELEKAVVFFETAAKQSTYKWLNPSQFCLPFYLSFNNIIFKKQVAKDEMDKYLVEAKDAVKGSKNKKLLFEAIENLSSALIEVQRLGDLDLEAKKGELNFYREYCDRAEELMRETEEIAPYATATMRRGMPILGRNLKNILEEIQEKAKNAYKQSRGTVTEELTYSVCAEVHKWEIGNQEYLLVQIVNMVDLLKSYIPKNEENSLILMKVDTMFLEPDIVKQYMLLNNLVPQIMNIQMSKEIKGLKGSADELKGSVDELKASINGLPNKQEYLDIIQRDLKEIKNYMPGMKEEINEILSQLKSPSSSITQKLQIAIPIIPQLVTYKVEADAPKLVDDIKHELKGLLKFKN